MEWETVFKIFGAAVLSAGGVGAIIVACIKLASGIITDRLMKRYEAKLSKEIEAYKHDLELETEKYRQKAERLTFVTHKQFETEFEIYQKLFDALFDFSRYTAELYPMFDELPDDERKQKKIFAERYKNYQTAFNLFSEILEKSAPFIPKKNYELFYYLRQLAVELGCMYQDIRFNEDEDLKDMYSKITLDNHNKSDEFVREIEKAKDTIREYLATLKVEKE